MNKHCAVLLLLVFGWVPLCAEGVIGVTANATALRPVGASPVFFLDTFEDGDHLKNPTWWVFGNLNISVGYNTSSAATPFVQKRSLVFRGEPARYMGGVGMYYPMDLSPFGGVRLVLWGDGPDSGHLQIQLFDDDNGNFVVDLFSDMKNTPSKDDKWLHTLRVDWQGWREIVIPFSKFHDGNPGIGDGVWNPNREKNSGGFLQMQLMAMAINAEVPLFVKLDSVGFVGRAALPEENMPSGDILEEPSFHENIDKVVVPMDANIF